MTATTAIPVHEESQVGQVRRAAAGLATRLEFGPTRVGQTELIATELGTNLIRHARRGEVLLRAVPDPEGRVTGVELVAIDAGPGMADAARSRVDGYSTAGSLGHGLGTIERLADEFDLYTQPAGSAILARIWKDSPPPRSRSTPVQIGAVQVPKPGETVCGDGMAWSIRPGRVAIVVADGLGHGVQAAEAADKAVAAFRQHAAQEPQRVLEAIHDALRSTRGAAVSVLAYDLERGIAHYAGLGNVTCATFVDLVQQRRMLAHNGIVGHSAAPNFQEFSYPVPRGALVVLYTDGLFRQWNLAAYPGLLTKDPSLVAALIYRDFSRRRDDATVVVARQVT